MFLSYCFDKKGGMPGEGIAPLGSNMGSSRSWSNARVFTWWSAACDPRTPDQPWNMAISGRLNWVGGKMATKQTRAWQRMLSGRRLDLLDPTPVDIEIEDIAHGLAFVARWNGQTKGDFAYSVAEHSLLVEEIFGRLNPKARTSDRLTALLHDAPEYVIGDMISPVKAAVGPDYEELDKRLTAAIHIRFGLQATVPVRLKKQIKKADRISAWMEAVEIAGFTREEADKLFGAPDLDLISDLHIRLRPPVETRNDFTARHAALLRDMP